MTLAERLALADANHAIRGDEVPPSSFQSLLLARRRNSGAFGSVAAGAGSNEVLHAGGSALGPGVEMVAVHGWPGTTALEPRLHLTLSAGPGHALAALLAGEAPHRIPAPDVPGVDDGAGNCQDYEEQAWQRDRSNDAVEQTADYVGAGRRQDSGSVCLRHQRQDARGEQPHRHGRVRLLQRLPSPIVRVSSSIFDLPPSLSALRTCCLPVLREIVQSVGWLGRHGSCAKQTGTTPSSRNFCTRTRKPSRQPSDQARIAP